MQSVFNISMRMQYRVVTYEVASDEETDDENISIHVNSDGGPLLLRLRERDPMFGTSCAVGQVPKLSFVHCTVVVCTPPNCL